MQLVMKFTQPYVNTHANKLFSLSFWPAASTGGIRDVKLCPDGFRTSWGDTGKGKDPSSSGDHRCYRGGDGQKRQGTYVSAGMHQLEVMELSQEAQRHTTRPTAQGTDQQPAAGPVRRQGRGAQGEPRGADAAWSHLPCVRSLRGAAAVLAATSPLSWGRERGESFFPLTQTKPPQTSPETGTQSPSWSINGENKEMKKRESNHVQHGPTDFAHRLCLRTLGRAFAAPRTLPFKSRSAIDPDGSSPKAHKAPCT